MWEKCRKCKFFTNCNEIVSNKKIRYKFGPWVVEYIKFTISRFGCHCNSFLANSGLQGSVRYAFSILIMIHLALSSSGVTLRVAGVSLLFYRVLVYDYAETYFEIMNKLWIFPQSVKCYRRGAVPPPTQS